MFRGIFSLVFCIIGGGSFVCAKEKEGSFPTGSIDQLKQRLVSIERSLDKLSRLNIRGGFGPIGISSQQYTTPQQSVWFEIKLEKLTPIDQIVIVPTVGQSSQFGIIADGFPVDFTILAGTESDTKGVVIARYDESDTLLPRTAPLIIDCSVEASWVRLEATRLSPHVLNKRYILKLAEVLIFSGSDNIALRRPVKTSKGFIKNKFAQHPKFVTDGFLPYLIDSAQGFRSRPFVGTSKTDIPYTLSTDLGAPTALTHINLHASFLNSSVPLYTTADEGIPYHWILEGALKKDFSDAVVLATATYESLLDVGPVLRHRTSQHPSRYIRLREVSPSSYHQDQTRRRSLSFAEIELISEGQNMAMGKPFTLNFQQEANIPASNLTDGQNFYGKILPVRQWLNELTERHQLILEKQAIYSTLETLYARQQSRFIWMQRIAIISAAGILIVIFVSRMIALRKIIHIRESIAANLHDELSANLHAVALLGDLAQKNIDRKTKLTEILDKIQDLSRHSRHAARHCMNMLQAETICDNLAEEIQRTSQRLLSEFDHELTVAGEEWLQQLSAQKRLDLSLYYKECLINILRHSDATACQTKLIGTPSLISLEVSDNGCPFSDLPPSLTRRVKILGASLRNESPKEGGNTLVLEMKGKRFSFTGKKHSAQPETIPEKAS